MFMNVANRWTSTWKAKVPTCDVLAAIIIFLTTFGLFWFSPVHQISDSNYSMVLSDCLLTNRTFKLDSCGVPVFEPKPRDNYFTNGILYQLEIVGNHVYYFFPPGSSVLSVPYVAAAKLFRVSPRDANGSFDWKGEFAIELSLAAVLMATLASLFFITSRLLLPFTWSVVIALGGSLGTQVWSTASRGLWSHTWSTLLAGVLVLVLATAELDHSRLRSVFLATLLSWMYFVRPTNSLVIAGVSVFVFLFYRRQFLLYALTGASWLAAFLYYSWHNFGRLLPNYYRDRLDFNTYMFGLKGTLISPSRGLFVYVPILIFTLLLLITNWKDRPLRRLTWLALFVIGATVLTIAGFFNWWGGDSFGARFTTDLVPWFVLLTIIAVRAKLNVRTQSQAWQPAWVIQIVFGCVLLAASVFINARGALAVETWRWNNIGLGNKLWDWREPQFLAGLVEPPLSPDYSPLHVDQQIAFDIPEDSNKYLWYGWSFPEAGFRWNDGKNASVKFFLNTSENLRLRMKLLPFIREGIWDKQRIHLSLNGSDIAFLQLTKNETRELTVDVPVTLLQQRNILRFKLPDAASPELLKLSPDQRQLAVAIYWIRLEAR